MASAGGRGASSSAAAAAAAAAAGEVGYKTDDDVRSYVRKRKRANKNCSVSHLRRALNIGYKKAKRIHDEVDDELRRERHDRRERGEDIGPRTPSRSHRGGGADDEDEDEDSDDGLDYDDPHDRREGSPHHDEDEHDDGDIPDEALREHIRKKLRRGEVIYVHHMRDLGLSYRRTRRILQEFIDQGKIQKLPRCASTPPPSSTRAPLLSLWLFIWGGAGRCW
jgi:predicted transcriptional regulator